MRNRKESFEQAKDYAFLLLKFRLRSERELETRLKKKKFSEEATRQVIAFLREKKFLDDKLFAKSWVQFRVRRSLGARRIKEELALKGIDKEIIKSELEELKKNYPEDKIVSKLAQERLSKLHGIEPRSAQRRVYAYLIRRGFSPEIVIDVVNNLCRQTF